MPLFEYRALNEQGQLIRGILDAQSLAEAKKTLVRNQIFAVTVKALSEKKRKKKPLEKRAILSLTRELACLLEAGLPLYDALSALEEKHRGTACQSILLVLCDQIRSGTSFSHALGKHPHCFDLLYRSLISNAEQTGQLSEALRELSHFMEKRLQMKKQLIQALLYPSLLGGFCIVVLMTLLLFVIPSLFELFEGKTLHPFTSFVFSCSHFVLSAKWLLSGLFIVASSAFCWVCSSKSAMRWVLGKFLNLPGLKGLFLKVALVRFFRATASLLDGGVSLVRAFEQAKEVLDHSLLETIVCEAKEKVECGESLQEALSSYKAIPSLVPRMLGIAQEGGNLSQMMRQISSIYEEELERKFSQIAALAQPILLLVLGGIVGFVLLAVLLPMTDVSGFASS